ncbi:MAG: penicillin acylase family protein [Woeseia sp.]
MTKLAWRITLVLLLLAAGVASTGYLMVRLSLPPIDGAILVKVLTNDVVVDRDNAGVPTIKAKNRNDLAFATGFVHGQDRFFQMDLMRRKAAGELAELFGQLALSLDRTHRLHRFRYRADQVVANLSPDEAQILAAYAQGVNAGLGSLRARPFEYFVLRVEPQAWEAVDSMLVAFAMFLELDEERAGPDIKRGLARRALPNEVFAWLYPAGTSWDAPLRGTALTATPVPTAESYNLRAPGPVPAVLPSTGEASDAPLPGSNSWAIAGNLSASGKAIIASDMHLPIAVPNTFYRARLVVTGAEAIDVSGVSLPGTPLIVAGSNGTVAWAFTNSYGDWSDAILIQDGEEEGTYLTPAGPRRFDTHREFIDVKDAETSELVIRETIWGPVLDDEQYPDGLIAVRWIAHDRRAVNLRHLDLERAQSVEQALAIANHMGMPPQNFVAGDSEGKIGWTIAGSIPRRADLDTRVPVDWSAGEGWLGWLDPDEYPRIVNPVSGRIWTANARTVDGEALQVIGDGGYDLGARAQQIRDQLFAAERFEVRDMLRIQLDDRAIFLSRWRDLLLRVLDDRTAAATASRQEYRDQVEGWLPRASVDSVGYRLVRAFRLAIKDRVFNMLTSPARGDENAGRLLLQSKQFEEVLWSLLHQQPMHLLAVDYGSWQDLMLAAVDEVIIDMETGFNGPMAERRWGERNTVSIRHPLSQALPLPSAWFDMPYHALPGDANMPRVQSPDFGASVRFALSPGDEPGGYLHMPTGQSGHPLSNFYRAGHEDWAEGRPSAFLPAQSRYRLVLTAASD